ncbi:hypothetical protein [Branchiibius sp. NY16-3462-2]|uniref:hypothetical protein n=1 Tax=Branchiibius sp. NY16-3462-2 TaxID=1807500 RepID=UPI0025BDE87D|nr:hypothetical protein [Branchiibius sp. NY16-3462-2]
MDLPVSGTLGRVLSRGRIVATIVVLACWLAACTPSPSPSSNSTSGRTTSTTASPTTTAAAGDLTVTADGVHGSIGLLTIDAPAGVAAEGTHLIVTPVKVNPAPAVAGGPAGVVDFKMSDGSQPAKPVRVSWSIGPGGAPGAATLPSNSRQWLSLPVTVTGNTATATLTHFSWGWFGDIKKMVDDFVAQVKKFLNIGYSKPACSGKSATVGSLKYTVKTDKDSVYACVANDNGQAVVKVYPNSGQVFRIRGQKPSMTVGSVHPASVEPSLIIVPALHDAFYGKDEGVLPSGSSDTYSTMQVAKGATSAYGQAQADPPLSLVPIAVLGSEMLFTMAGVDLGEVQDMYEWARCFGAAIPASKNSADLADYLSAGFTCSGKLASEILGDNFGTRSLSILAAIAGSAPGLFAGAIQGAVNEITGAKTVSFTVTGTADGSDGGVGATKVVKQWPNSHATVTTWDVDPCADGFGAESTGFATSTDTFTCGSMASALLACKADGQTVSCIQGAGNTLIRFTTSVTIPLHFDVQSDPSPLQVTLTNGSVCDVASHDQAEHYDGRQGWLYCSGGGLLLTDEATQSHYFNKTSPVWTADLAYGTARPSSVAVKQATYAG